MEVPYGADTVETVFESRKSRGLRQEHEKTVETLVEVRILLWLKKLKAKICEKLLA